MEVSVNRSLVVANMFAGLGFLLLLVFLIQGGPISGSSEFANACHIVCLSTVVLAFALVVTGAFLAAARRVRRLIALFGPVVLEAKRRGWTIQEPLEFWELLWRDEDDQDRFRDSLLELKQRVDLILREEDEQKIDAETRALVAKRRQVDRLLGESSVQRRITAELGTDAPLTEDEILAEITAMEARAWDPTVLNDGQIALRRSILNDLERAKAIIAEGENSGRPRLRLAAHIVSQTKLQFLALTPSEESSLH
jgi:hypothetical protein